MLRSRANVGPRGSASSGRLVRKQSPESTPKVSTSESLGEESENREFNKSAPTLDPNSPTPSFCAQSGSKTPVLLRDVALSSQSWPPTKMENCSGLKKKAPSTVTSDNSDLSVWRVYILKIKRSNR